MSKRQCKDWIKDFLEYANVGEAPPKFYFWVAASTIAGALRRRVWVDQGFFQWTPNMYIILVAPPGIVSKSTTASVGMNLLRDVNGINFGPDVVTWQKLVEDMGKSTEQVWDEGSKLYHPMSCLTLSAGEFGNLLNPSDREMVDVFVSLWDGQKGTFKKGTKSSGNDEIANPWVNIIACTTPAWIAGNFPDYMIGGGFTSRCLFIFAKEKHKLVAYPGRNVPKGHDELRAKLVHDLEIISLMFGQMHMEEEAMDWGELWYANHWKSEHKNLPQDQFGGYLARKQTHIHKLAIILSAARGDTYTITRRDLEDASEMVDTLEEDMPYVFAQMGRTSQTMIVNELVDIMAAARTMPTQELYRKLSRKCTWTEFTEVISSATNAGYIRQENRAGTMTVIAGRTKDYG